MKLKLQDKLEIIKLYVEGFPSKKIALKYSVGITTIKGITRQYREYGIESFKEKTTNRKHSVEFKLQIVNRILNGEAITSIANELMINNGLLFSWVKKYKELGYNGLEEKTKGRSRKMENNNKPNSTIEITNQEKRIKELEERNAQLEMENDLLKKLKALVQQREQQQNKKK